jgi:hypothetical protein
VILIPIPIPMAIFCDLSFTLFGCFYGYNPVLYDTRLEMKKKKKIKYQGAIREEVQSTLG